MSSFKAITFENFKDKSWIRPVNYNYASKDTVVALGAAEIPVAIMQFAIGFVPDDENFIPVAIQGIENGHNLMVDENGRWIGEYVPATYRAYPFRLARGEGENHFLCINEDSNLVMEAGKGEPFYDGEGKLAVHTKNAMNLLVDAERDRLLAVKISKALNYAGVIQPWDIQLEFEGQVQKITGLFKISEDKLNGLDAEAFADLREGGSITLAYCQLLSMRNIQKLGRLAWSRKDHEPEKKKETITEFSFGNDSGTLSFENL